MKMKILYTGFVFLFIMLMVAACAPKQSVEFRGIRNMRAEVDDKPVIKSDVVFYNPNKQKGELKKIDAVIYVSGKKSAAVNQEFSVPVKGESEFIVPLEINVDLKEEGVLNNLLGLLGAKKVKVKCVGTATVKYKGIRVKVPFDKEEEIKLKW